MGCGRGRGEGGVCCELEPLIPGFLPPPPPPPSFTPTSVLFLLLLGSGYRHMIFHGVLCTLLRNSCSLKFSTLNKDALSIIIEKVLFLNV